MIPYNDRFTKACFLEETDQIPVWFMRQAGRYQRSYRDIRSKYSIKEICKTPEICHKVSHLPVDQFNLDAAILFSDIMIPLEPMGIEFDYKPGIGPVLNDPVRNIGQVKALKKVEVEDSLSYTGETLNMLKDSLNIPCIGFVGAPFTLASYIIEGGPSKNYRHLKTFMYRQTDAWHLLMEKLSELLIEYSLRTSSFLATFSSSEIDNSSMPARLVERSGKMKKSLFSDSSVIISIPLSVRSTLLFFS